MSERTIKAAENHKKGMNCAQAVACAFADAVGVDENTIFQMGEGFGLGMGGMEGTCGAVSGAVLVAGMLHSTADVNNPTSKRVTAHYAQEIVKAFKEKNGSVICKELKGMETKEVLRSCAGCIEDATAIAERVLELRTAPEQEVDAEE